MQSKLPEISKTVRLFFAALLLSLASCSTSSESYVAVRESELGKWQREVQDIKLELALITEPDKVFSPYPTWAYAPDQVRDILDKIEDLHDRMDALERRLERNFVDSEELPNGGIPSRYR